MKNSTHISNLKTKENVKYAHIIIIIIIIIITTTTNPTIMKPSSFIFN